MTRKEIINYCRENIFPFVDWSVWDKGGLMETVKMVCRFRREHGYPKEMHAVVDDGFLIINDVSVGRIARKMNRPFGNDERSYQIEGRILARQENYYD